jgi:hypothetical protein
MADAAWPPREEGYAGFEGAQKLDFYEDVRRPWETGAIDVAVHVQFHCDISVPHAAHFPVGLRLNYQLMTALVCVMFLA